MEEEISLRELIEALLRRKKMIVGVTALALFTSAIVSYFILKPVYETRMVLMASNFTNQLQNSSVQGQGVEGVLDALSRYPNMTLETYRQQVTAPRIMREVIQELGLEAEYDVERLANAITLTTVNNTNLITISMRHGDPAKAAEIVNKVGEKFVGFVSSKAQEQATTTTQYIENQIVEEKEKLDAVLLEQKSFLSQPKGTKELARELDAKLSLLTEYKTELINSQIERDVLLTTIQATEDQLAATAEKLETQRSITEDALMSAVASETYGQSVTDLTTLVMENEEINPVFVALSNSLANNKISMESVHSRIDQLTQQITVIQRNIDDLQAELADKEHQEGLINQRVQIAQNTYQAFVNKLEELRVTESAQVGESSMIVISRAFPTSTPVAPRKALNVAIASVLGLMVSVFLAFFLEYWEASERALKEKQKKAVDENC